MWGLEDFQPIFRKARAEFEGVFLFSIESTGPMEERKQLRLVVTDFSSSTWAKEMGPDDLETLWDRLGIERTMPEFLAYVHQAFSSGPVVISRREGHDSLMLKGTKGPESPMVSVQLQPVQDPSRLITHFALSMYEAFGALQAKLEQERETSGRLARSLAAAERAKTEALQLQRGLGASSAWDGTTSDWLPRGDRSASLPPYTPSQATLPPASASSAPSPGGETQDVGGSDTRGREGPLGGHAGGEGVLQAAVAGGGGAQGSAAHARGHKRPLMTSKRIRGKGTALIVQDDEEG